MVSYATKDYLIRNSQFLYAEMILNVALSDNMVSMASNIFWQIRAKYSPEQYCIIKGNDYLIAIYSRAAAVPTMAEKLEHVYFLIESIGASLTCIIQIKTNFNLYLIHIIWF